MTTLGASGILTLFVCIAESCFLLKALQAIVRCMLPVAEETPPRETDEDIEVGSTVRGEGIEARLVVELHLTQHEQQIITREQRVDHLDEASAPDTQLASPLQQDDASETKLKVAFKIAVSIAGMVASMFGIYMGHDQKRQSHVVFMIGKLLMALTFISSMTLMLLTIIRNFVNRRLFIVVTVATLTMYVTVLLMILFVIDAIALVLMN